MLKPLSLPSVKFDNSFTAALPADPETANFRRQVENACYSRVLPQKVPRPKLIIYAPDMAKMLGFPKAFCASDEFVQIFSGNRMIPGMDPHAVCYGGHQFGNWAGQLGDGRAIALGEIITPSGQRQTLQLKGAGPTPYSRNADGLAVLRSSIREFLCSEAMYHLGIPTTRALSLVLTGDQVERDMFYNGNPQLEPGAIVCRVAPSFTRFGNFEILASRDEISLLKDLCDYTIKTSFPHIKGKKPDIYIEWFKEICDRTCDLIVHWMRVGFVHGVMNTDNMSITGLTIDYGPYGWLEDYNPAWTPNTTDAGTRRYCFVNQPQIALWNIVQLGNALYPVIKDAKPLQDTINDFALQYQVRYRRMMAAKLGLFDDESQDELLIKDILELMSLTRTDMTIFFRNMALLNPTRVPDSPDDFKTFLSPLMEAFYQPEQLNEAVLGQFHKWFKKYETRNKKENLNLEKRKQQMNRGNPRYVLRNYLAHLAIEKAETGDFSMVHELYDLIKKPYDDQPGKEDFATKQPEWARTRPGCSMLSCSS